MARCIPLEAFILLHCWLLGSLQIMEKEPQTCTGCSRQNADVQRLVFSSAVLQLALRLAARELCKHDEEHLQLDCRRLLQHAHCSIYIYALQHLWASYYSLLACAW
jgi:hypothetical protein